MKLPLQLESKLHSALQAETVHMLIADTDAGFLNKHLLGGRV